MGIITTTPAVERHKITEYFGVISGEANLTKITFNFHKELTRARNEALKNLWENLPSGANAIVGASTQCILFMGLQLIIYTGTAVHVEKQ